MGWLTQKIKRIKSEKLRTAAYRTRTAILILVIAAMFFALIAISNKPFFNFEQPNRQYLWIKVNWTVQIIVVSFFVAMVACLIAVATIESYNLLNSFGFNKLKRAFYYQKSFWLLLINNQIVGLFSIIFIIVTLYNRSDNTLTKLFFFNLFFIVFLLFAYNWFFLWFYLNKLCQIKIRRERAIFTTINLLSCVFWPGLVYVSIFNSWIILFLLLMLISLTDTLSYIFGTLWGKKKIFQSISPHKTFEGFLGGVVGAVGLTYGFLILTGWISTVRFESSTSNQLLDAFWFTKYQQEGELFLNKRASWWILAIFIMLCLSLTGVAGDLFFSKMKRLLGIKDYSKLLGKHGGFYDRFDSIIFGISLYFLANIIDGMIFFNNR